MAIYYTGKGDKGRSYVGKKSFTKTNLFVEALGELDELNSMLGVLKASSARLRKTLHQVQEDLFIIQANLAYAMLKEKRKPPIFPVSKLAWSERIIDDIERCLKSAKGFVIPGATVLSAQLDVLRARSRKVERVALRAACKPNGTFLINPDIFPYLNRLSSLLFALARDEAIRAGKKERHPTYK